MLSASVGSSDDYVGEEKPVKNKFVDRRKSGSRGNGNDSNDLTDNTDGGLSDNASTSALYSPTLKGSSKRNSQKRKESGNAEINERV